MKTFILAASLFLPLFAQAAPQAPERLNEGRCFDMKQAVIADLKTKNVAKKEEIGVRIDRLAEKCDQPQLASLLRKALDRRVASTK